MGDLVISFIRTVVPTIVGAVASYLATKGVDLAPETVAALATFLTGLFGSIYYAVARLLEEKWPNAGILLGVRKTPIY
jgi:uncharacterized membrane protein